MDLTAVSSDECRSRVVVRKRSTPRRSLLLVGFFCFQCSSIFGCGGTSADQSTAEPGSAARAWERLEGARLRDYVADRAIARLERAQRDMHGDKLKGFWRNPATAPALTGRACEHLIRLASVALAAGQLNQAAGTVRLIRQRASNRNLAFAGTAILAEVARRQAGSDREAQESALEKIFRELPPERFGSATVLYQLFQTEKQVSVRLEQIKTQLVSLDTAATALFFSQILPEIVRHRTSYLAALNVVHQAHQAAPERKEFAFATVDLSGAKEAHPVRVAVWDVGTAPDLFSEQLFTNPGETENGADDDGNGQIDDIHGIVSDGDARNTELFFVLPDDVVTQYSPFLKGIMDLRAGMVSTEAAQRVLGLARSATTPKAQQELERNLDAISEWAHGTHVAGVLLDGVPQAQMAIFRSAWAGETRTYYHRGPTNAELARERANMEAVAEFIRRHNIRVVNVSLGFSQDYVESQLRHEKRYTRDAQVRARARDVHARREGYWRAVFSSCPSTLFVVAAGNSNRDVVEYGELPASIRAENVLVVGAVNRFGAWAGFTNSNAERVRVFDRGTEVESLLPSGARAPLSGTSMAAPRVANLAAKLYSVNPELSPREVVAAIESSGSRIASPFNGTIADQHAAIVRARALRRKIKPSSDARDSR